MLYLIIKAVHIIFMVSYFAGIFYLVRLFVYYKDTDDMPTEKSKILREQYVFMIRRLWNIITVPAGIIMAIAGFTMIYLNSGLLSASWFHIKLSFLLLLGYYHFWCWQKIKTIKNLNGSSLPGKNVSLRMANEVATLILFCVVFTVILKYQVVQNWWQLIGGFIVFAVVIMGIVKLVNANKNRQKN